MTMLIGSSELVAALGAISVSCSRWQTPPCSPLVSALLLGLHHPMKIKAFVLKSFFTFEYYNFQWEIFST